MIPVRAMVRVKVAVQVVALVRAKVAAQAEANRVKVARMGEDGAETMI